MGASVVQNTYYSQRRTFSFFTGTELTKQVYGKLDPQGRPIDSTYEVVWNETEFECKIVRIKPDYLVLHVWEPAFTPEFMYDYPQRHNDTLVPVKTFVRNGQLMAVIYKFVAYPKIDSSKVNCTWVYDRPDPATNLTLSVRDPYYFAIPSKS